MQVRERYLVMEKHMRDWGRSTQTSGCPCRQLAFAFASSAQQAYWIINPDPPSTSALAYAHLPSPISQGNNFEAERPGLASLVQASQACPKATMKPATCQLGRVAGVADYCAPSGGGGGRICRCKSLLYSRERGDLRWMRQPKCILTHTI